MNGLTSFDDIGVEVQGVSSVMSGITEVYEDLENKVDEITKKRDVLDEYWECQEAGEFVQQMNVVINSFADFSTHYGQFMKSLAKIMEIYGTFEEDILASNSSFDE